MTPTSRLDFQPPIATCHLQLLWNELAGKYFHNRLPHIRIEWSSRLTASAGLFVSQVGPRSYWLRTEERHGRCRMIRLSAPLLHNQPESEIIRTLAHEMIHQWQYDVRKRRPNHGSDFREIMAIMNGDGLGITVRHSLDHQVEALNKYAWECSRCGKAYHRQRRTISPPRHQCGTCQGPLVEISLDSQGFGKEVTNTRWEFRPAQCSDQKSQYQWQNVKQLIFEF